MRTAGNGGTGRGIGAVAVEDRAPGQSKTWCRIESAELSLRLSPELHASVAVKAELANKSINQRVSDVPSREEHA